MEVRIEHISEQEDGRFTIIFRDPNGKQIARENCDFCYNGKAEMFDDEYITVHFEHIVPIKDIDWVREQYRSVE